MSEKSFIASSGEEEEEECWSSQSETEDDDDDDDDDGMWSPSLKRSRRVLPNRACRNPGKIASAVDSFATLYGVDDGDDDAYKEQLESEDDQMQPPPKKKSRRNLPSRVCKNPKRLVFAIDRLGVLHIVKYETLRSQARDAEISNYTKCKGSSEFETLKEKIIEQSQADGWMEAKSEWRLQYIYYKPNGTCLCTHHPITDHCVIKNWKNNEVATVGNVCIKQFNSSHLIIEPSCWSSLRSLRKNPSGSTANASLLKLAHDKRIIWRKEMNSYRSYTTGKGSRNRFNPEHYFFSPTAYKIREIMNKRILYGFHSQRPHCRCGFAKPCCSSSGKFFYGCWNWISYQDRGCNFFQEAPPLL